MRTARGGQRGLGRGTEREGGRRPDCRADDINEFPRPSGCDDGPRGFIAFHAPRQRSSLSPSSPSPASRRETRRRCVREISGRRQARREYAASILMEHCSCQSRLLLNALARSGVSACRAASRRRRINSSRDTRRQTRRRTCTHRGINDCPTSNDPALPPERDRRVSSGTDSLSLSQSRPLPSLLRPSLDAETRRDGAAERREPMIAIVPRQIPLWQ
jgi:hypothetical protein